MNDTDANDLKVIMEHPLDLGVSNNKHGTSLRLGGKQ